MYKIRVEDTNGKGYETIGHVLDMGDCYQVSSTKKIPFYLNKCSCTTSGDRVEYRSEYLRITFTPI